MLKTLATFALFLGVLASSLLGSFGATTAQAATRVNFISWQKDVIYVYDTTSTVKKSDKSLVWAVSAAAERWDDNNPVDFRYTTKPCPKDSQCVIVKQAELRAPAVGSTSIATAGTDIKAVTVVLDTSYGRTKSSAQRRSLVCHELGHALGLKHRDAKTTCLTSYAGTTRYPDATDIKNLNVMYGWR